MPVHIKGGGKGRAMKETRTLFSDGEVPTAIRLEGAAVKTLMADTAIKKKLRLPKSRSFHFKCN